MATRDGLAVLGPCGAAELRVHAEGRLPGEQPGLWHVLSAGRGQPARCTLLDGLSCSPEAFPGDLEEQLLAAWETGGPEALYAGLEKAYRSRWAAGC